MLLLISIFFLISIILLVIGYKKIKTLKDSFELVEKKNIFMLKARDNLLRSVNHELRAPLTRMNLDLEFLEASETRDSLRKDIGYMQELVEELMEIEKVKFDQTQREDLVLIDLLNEVISKLKVDTSLIDFEVNEQVKLKGHRFQLEKLFKNLIENAFKYKTDEARIFIKVLEPKNDKLTITIMNDGSNIPSEDIPFIFEPFFRVDKSRSSKSEGLGLGLNICKEIIEVHNGKIQVSSKKDMGTIFKVTFPINYSRS